ncbi:putative Ycii-related domain protein [Seiridium unicorne]|uniref:Ycii-related domain protein n=1 Tax=Seiridium unicorne TaxID=138068 RepID=A0ABR2VF33_9PEZI
MSQFRRIANIRSGPLSESFRRSVTTQSSIKREWLVIAPDEIGAYQRRQDARPQHLKEIIPDIESGFLVFGGPYFSEKCTKEGESAMIGSVLVAVAETKDDVINRLKKDRYTELKVWDWDKVQIYPFNSTVRMAK